MQDVALTDYREVGARLGAYIRTNNPSTQQIQGLLADLLAGNELLPTMKEVVSLPSFHGIQALTGSGGGAVQRDALLQELGRRYLPSVLEEVAQTINGMLDIPVSSAPSANTITADKTNDCPSRRADPNASGNADSRHNLHAADIPKGKKPLLVRLVASSLTLTAAVVIIGLALRILINPEPYANNEKDYPDGVFLKRLGEVYSEAMKSCPDEPSISCADFADQAVRREERKWKESGLLP